MNMEEINYKRINTGHLWERFALDKDLSIVDGSLRLHSTQTYDFGNNVIDDENLDIKDIAVNECDVIYLIDSTKIFTYEKDSNTRKEVGCRSGEQPITLTSPSGIGIDNDTIYVADSEQVIALARSNLQIRWILSKGPDGKPLDKIKDLTNGFGNYINIIQGDRILRVHKSGCIETPSIGSGSLEEPSDIAVDANEDIYVLDKSKKAVYIFEVNGESKASIPIKDFSPQGLAVYSRKEIGAKTQIYVGESNDTDKKEKTIYRVEGGTETWIPLWSYRDATRKLITDSKNNLYVITGKGNKLIFLKNSKTNSLNEEGLYSGYYISKPIDSHDSKTRWHRFLMDGEFKKGTQIELSYYTANADISEYIKKWPEKKWHKALPGTSSIQGEEKRDALFQENIEGRYLWFKISLTGSEKISPAVKSLTIIFPRITYMDYLPAIYQEDTSNLEFQEQYISGGFLERFLSIFESIFSEIDFNIDHLSRFFDARGAPEDFLSWLGLWLSLSMDENFSENMKRLYLHKAVSLYKKRGTREGLEDTIAFFLYTKKHPDQRLDDIIAQYKNEKPFIVENFQVSDILQKKGNGKCLVEQYHLFFPPDEATVEYCLFRWDEIPGADSDILITYLKNNFDVDWVTRDKVKKINDEKIISESNGHSLSLELNTVKTDDTTGLTDTTDTILLKIDNEKKENKLILKRENEYLFCWDEIPGADSDTFITYLKNNFDVDWVTRDKIKKINDKEIKISNSHSLSLELYNDTVLLKIKNEIEREFLKTENCRVNIYEKDKIKIYNRERLKDILFSKEPFYFCVFIRDSTIKKNILSSIERIIEEQKPAHTFFGLKVLEPFFYLDMHTYLEVNTKLAKPVFTLDTSAIGRDTILDDKEHSGQIERHSRIGIDTLLT